MHASVPPFSSTGLLTLLTSIGVSDGFCSAIDQINVNKDIYFYGRLLFYASNVFEIFFKYI